MVSKSMTKAEICIIEGEQGSGKTNTAVAKIVDATFANITSVKLIDRIIIKAEPAIPPKPGVAKLWLPHQGPTTTKLPVGSCAEADSIKVFANFHLYGIKYIYADLATIVGFLNSDLITDGYIIIDESYIGGDARMGMTLMTKVLTWFGSQIRKRGLHLILIAQHGRMIDWRFRLFMTEHILCSYNEKTHMITLTVVERNNKKKRTYSYNGSQYWKYYNTNELPQIPEAIIAKTLVGAR